MDRPTDRLRELGGDIAWSLLDAAPDGAIISSAPSGEIVFANATAERMLGYEPGTLVGRTVEDLLPASLGAVHRSHRAGFAEDPRPRAMGPGRRLRAQRRDGSDFPVEISLSPWRHGEELFVFSCLRDVTESVEAEARTADERRSSEQALADSRRSLREAEHAVAVAEVRERIARDLHDTVIQRIFGAGLNLQATLGLVEDPDVRARLERAVDELDGTISDLRSTIFDLRGDPLPVGGLRDELAEIIDGVAESSQLDTRLELEGPLDAIEPHIVDHLLPTLREALSNVAHHADARHVRIALTVGEGEVSLAVGDDGRGMPGEVLGGRGLDNMRARADELGGTLVVDEAATGGTCLRWTVPRVGSSGDAEDR